MNYKGLFQRAILLISSPVKAWEEIRLEDKRAVFAAFVYPMIGLCGLSVFIGILLEGGETGTLVFQRAMTACCSIFVSLFGGYFLAAYGINLLGVKMFALRNDLLLIQQFAGYALVVTFWLDVITGLIPDFYILSWIFQFYIIYVVWEGARILISVDEKKRMSYTIMVSAFLVICPAVLGFIFNKLTVILN